MLLYRIFSYIFLFILLLLVLIFILINVKMVNLNYYFSSVDLPLSFIVMISVGIGVLLGIISLLPTVLRLYFSNKLISRRLNSYVEYYNMQKENQENIDGE